MYFKNIFVNIFLYKIAYINAFDILRCNVLNFYFIAIINSICKNIISKFIVLISNLAVFC